eukprot:6204071-Pleurochrysis_carterae.AAC.2
MQAHVGHDAVAVVAPPGPERRPAVAVSARAVRDGRPSKHAADARGRGGSRQQRRARARHAMSVNSACSICCASASSRTSAASAPADSVFEVPGVVIDSFRRARAFDGFSRNSELSG